jgi:hypothetical protein
MHMKARDWARGAFAPTPHFHDLFDAAIKRRYCLIDEATRRYKPLIKITYAYERMIYADTALKMTALKIGPLIRSEFRLLAERERAA